MKSVLISINPRWCELIASGSKTVEVRKTKPKLETPFKVYIYETQGRMETPFIDEEGHHIFKGRGQVIGEFVCNKITTAECGNYCILTRSETQLGGLDLLNYADEKTVYGWHISDLVIYDKPRELSEFKQVKKIRGYHKKDEPKTEGINIQRILHSSRVEVKYFTRPPQSWCYVESEDTK